MSFSIMVKHPNQGYEYKVNSDVVIKLNFSIEQARWQKDTFPQSEIEFMLKEL